ncbi:nascent polypeptide-associated complex subunit alpha, muscle-specific form isoform X3 [Lingula anatina]|uniref:Nascent polypeptide-associated complex subunit alpha, muscle-specific form isoform X3 n=1 Tax=Lingula anatina TaxID=7574 RepID=A0A2R2MLC9_LINAN|nr:nascent polypeptide-associated complex subunit alpha, muscle-specific form isoform X3 [Lingula anatina]|eukprot:XP_023931031.1 nascent polypeptide-associated complex subunit alpha, muscle-specific form isoform X3 [Lingula anatina]
MSSQLTYEAFADFFIKADTDRSMELSIDELIESLSKHGYVGKEQQIRRAFKDADTDGDGQISFEEYMTAMGFTLIKKHKGTALWRSFQEFDKSNSGFVVYTQVEIILQRVRKHFIFSEYRKLTDLAAKMKDSNGKLNYMDYVHELVKMGLIEIEGITELKEAKQKIAEREVKEEVTAQQTQQVTMTAKPGETVAAASPLEEAPGFPRLAVNKPAEASTQNAAAGLKMPPKTQPKPGQAPPPGQKVASPTSPAKTPPATPPGKAETPKAAEPPLPKQEPPKPEAPKQEPPKQEQPKPEPPKPAAEPEQPKPEPPKPAAEPEPPKPAAEPKAEAASVSVQLEQPKPVEPEPPKPAEPEPPKKEEPEPPKAAEPEVPKAAEPEQPKPVEPEEPAPVQEVVVVQPEPENKADNEAEQAKPEEPMTPVDVQVAEVKEVADTQPEVAVCPGAGVPWSISTHYLTRNANEAMGILGDIPELGSWQPSQTVLATENPAGSGNWTCSLSLPPNTPFEWKWVVVPLSRGWVSRWELDPNPPRGNRKSNSGPGPKTVHYAWID